MNIIDLNHPESLSKAAAALRQGGVVVFPTDTVYGVGSLLDNLAVKKLYRIKQRPENQPTAILMTRKMLLRNSKLQAFIGQLEDIHGFLVGQTTVILRADLFNIDFPSVVMKERTVAIRLPKFSWLEELMNRVGPIVASSANKKGRQTPNSFGELEEGILEEADLVVKTESELGGKPSAIYHLERREFLRK